MEKINPFIRTFPSDSLSVVKNSATALFIPNYLFPVKPNRIFLLAKAFHSFKRSKWFIIGLLLIVTSVESVSGANRYSVATGNWSATSTWSATSGGTSGVSVPVAGDIVYIERNFTVTTTAAAACADVNIASGSALTIGGYNFTSSGTATISGTITHTSTNGTKTFNNVVISGGTWTSSAAETYSIASLTLSGSTITGSNTGLFNISGNMSVTAGTINALNGLTITVTGTTTINGTVNILSTTGTKTFTGLVTINSTGDIENSSVNESMIFQGGITNNGGTFNAGTSVQTFNTNNQALTGTLLIPSVTVTGVTLTNNGNLTVSTALAGNALTNSATGTLNLGGTSGITTLTATAAGNTVNYTGTGQTIKATTYATLNITAAGTETAGGAIMATTLDNGGASNVASVLDMGGNTLTATTIDNTGATIKFSGASNGKAIPTGTVEYSATGGGQNIATGTYNNFTLDNTSGTNTALGNLNVTGTLTTTSGGTLNMVTYALVAGTNPVNNGIIRTQNTSGTPVSSGLTWGGTVTYDGTAQTVVAGVYNNLTLSGSGAKTIGSITINSGGTLTTTNLALTFGGDFINNGTFLGAGSSPITIAGTATQNIAGFTTTGLVSMTKTGGTATFTGNVSGAGLTINGPGGTLHLGTGLTHTFTGDITLTAGTLNGGSSTLNENNSSVTAWNGTGTVFTPGTGTVNFGGVAQTLSASATTFNNLTLAGGSGTKTFSSALTTNAIFTINSGVIANLGTFSLTANTLTLGGNGQHSGTWGSTASTATYKNSIYFGTTATGTLNVQGSTCVAGSWTGASSTDWNTATNWCDGVVPTSSTNVTINSGGNQPVISATAVCNTLTINSGATLTVSGSNTLTVSSNWTNNGGTFTPGTGTVTMNGVTQIGGTASTSFNNLSLTGTASVTTGIATTVSGNLTIGDGTVFTVAGYNLTVGGTTTLGGGTSGTLNITSATGTKLFTGLVTVAAGATWTNTSVNSPVTFRGGITNNGTFNAGSGIQTFDTNAQPLTGTLSLTTIIVTTIALTNTGTGNLSVGTSLSGTGTLNNAGTMNIGGTCTIPTLTNTGTLTLGGSGAITGIVNSTNGIVNLNSSGTITSFNNSTASSLLNISALTVPTITTLTVSTADNTVNYNGAGAQTVIPVAYSNLTLNGSGNKTTGGAVTIGANLNIGDGITFTSNNTLGVTGTTTVGGGTSGTLAITSTTGTKTFTGAVTINSGGVISESVAENLTFGSDVTITGTLTENGAATVGIAGNLTNNGTYTASTGVHTFSGATKTISGSSAISIPNVAVSGTYTNNGTLTVGTALAGSGTLTNTGTLNIGGSSSITTFANSGTTAVTGSGAISTALANFTNTGTLNLGGSGTITGITNNAAGIVNLASSGTITSFNNATATSILTISDLTIPTITTLTVSTSGNTVNYNGAGNQTVNDASSGYSNINFSGSGTKTFTVGAARTANILTVASGVTLLLNGANTLTPTSAVINGNVQVTNGIVVNTTPTPETGDGKASLVGSAGTISFTSGSFFYDDINGGIIPVATWDNNSTCDIRGYIDNPDGTVVPNTFQVSLHQDFGNFTWNSPNQVVLNTTDNRAANYSPLSFVSFGGQLTHVKSNLSIINTGTGKIALGNGGTGSLIDDGNFIQTGGSFMISGSSAKQMTVTGNFSLSGGTFDLSSSTTTGNYTNLNVAGNFSFTSGTITESGSTTASIINFDGTGTQTFTSGGTLSNMVNFAILPGATVDFGTSIISSGSTGSFTMNPGGTLITANTAGITTSGATGSIQLSGTRTYYGGGNYVYNGTAAQVTGNGLSQNSPASVTISNTNSAGVTFSAATSMNYMIINSGSIANLGTFTHTASALFLSGNAYSTGTWGGTGSGASNINTTYFTANTGIVTLSNSVRDAFTSSTTITIPCGVTSVIAEAWGGGGAGSTLVTLTNGGGGGGGGAYSRGVVTVTPQATYTITVGGGGSGTVSGGDSWFSTAATVMAKGGSGATTDSNAGATGGQASSSVTTAGGTTLSGGNGANASGTGVSGYAGGGGSSSGTTLAGINAVTGVNTGATAPAGGGNGGNGYNGSTGPGGAGFTPGGGGGGAYRVGTGISTGGSGGGGQVIITFTNVIPTITLGSNPSVCQGTTTANLPYSATTGCPDKYSIVYDATALAAGFVNVSRASLTSTPIILSVPAGAPAATYNGSLSLVNSSTGSPSAKYPITVTLNLTPAITNMTATTCNGGTFSVTPVNGTNGVVPTGTTYSWSVPTVTGGMTGGASGSGASTISGTITNPTNTAQTATYTVTPISGTTGNCPGNPFTVTLTVNPVPAITAITMTACSGGGFTATPVNGANGIVPSGTTYSWPAPVVTGGMTGGDAGSSALAVSDTLINPTNTSQTATYTLTPISGSCSGNTFTVTVTVNPMPNITAMATTASSGGAFSVTPVNSINGLIPTGTTYSWPAPSGTGFTGGAASSGSPAGITGTLTLNTTITTATATYTVTPTSGSCSGNTFTVTVTITPNLWLGTSTSTDWNLGTNWVAGVVPASGDDVIFSTTANNDLVLDGVRTIGNLTNRSTKRLYIPSGKCLTINGNIDTNNDPNRIYIQSSPSTPNGSLIFTTSSPVYATVEMYTQASKGSGITVGTTTYYYSWQYFGIPVHSIANASPTFDGSFVRAYNEDSTGQYKKWAQLNNLSPLNSFLGYEITQVNPATIVFQGVLENQNKTITLTNTIGAYNPGQNIISNSFTAAIDIRQLTFGSNTEQTIYLFNTGSFGQWFNSNGTYYTDPSLTIPGQYLAIPKNNAGTGTYPHNIPYDIPSMSGFLVRDTISGANGSITINYNSTDITQNVNPQRAPSQVKQASDKVYLEITLKGKRTGDCMWLINQPGTTHGFDNGWDGYKISGTLGTPQLFAMEESGNYQVSTSSDMSNTYLGFQAGLDLEDTLSFYSENLSTQYAGIYLDDLVANKVIDISTSGTQYAFVADSTGAPVKRFLIVTNPTEVNTVASTQLKVFNSGNTVFIQNSGKLNGEMIVYDMMGRDIRIAPFGPYGVTAVQLETISGAYIIKAATDKEIIIKKIIF